MRLRRLEEPELSLRLASVTRPDVPAHWYYRWATLAVYSENPNAAAGPRRGAFVARKGLRLTAAGWGTPASATGATRPRAGPSAPDDGPGSPRRAVTGAAGAAFPRWLGMRPWSGSRPSGPPAPATSTPSRAVHTRSLLIGDAPPGLTPGWLAAFLLSAGDVTLSVHAVPMAPGEADRALRLRRTQYLTDIQQRLQVGARGRPGRSGSALQSATMIEAQVKAGHARLFRTGIVLTLRAPTIPALAELERGIRDQLDTLGATAWPLTFEHQDGFREAMPLFVRRLGREQVFDTTSLAYSFLFDASNVSMPAGPVWGYTTRGRRPVLYDPRNQALGVENPHVAIVGPSGVGKSVAFAAILVETMVGPLESRPDQVCAGRPQEGLRAPVRLLRRGAGALGGRPAAARGQRPAALPRSAHLDQQLQDVLGLLALATTTPTAPMSPEDYAFWEWALRVTYKRFGIVREDEATLAAHRRRDAPHARGLPHPARPVRDDRRPGERHATGRRWRRCSAPWAVGVYSGLFARHTTADLAAERLVVFDLEGLTHGDDALGRLRPMATYLIALFVFGQARAPGARSASWARTRWPPCWPTPPRRASSATCWRWAGATASRCSTCPSSTSTTPRARRGRRAMTSTATKLLLKQVGGENIAGLAKDFQLTARLKDFALGAKVGTPGRWGSDGLMVTPAGTETIEILPPPEVLELLRPPDGAAVHPPGAGGRRGAICRRGEGGRVTDEGLNRIILALAVAAGAFLLVPGRRAGPGRAPRRLVGASRASQAPPKDTAWLGAALCALWLWWPVRDGWEAAAFAHLGTQLAVPAPAPGAGRGAVGGLVAGHLPPRVPPGAAGRLLPDRPGAGAGAGRGGARAGAGGACTRRRRRSPPGVVATAAGGAGCRSSPRGAGAASAPSRRCPSATAPRGSRWP